jgi:hypothetical protein
MFPARRTGAAHSAVIAALWLATGLWLAEILGRFEEIALPDSWLVAGCIAQTIYRSRLARSQKIHWRATDKPSSIRSRVRS